MTSLSTASFDIGTKNMAYVCISNDNGQVLECKLSNLRNTNIMKEMDNTIEFLDSLHLLQNATTILIERQLHNNTKAVCMQNRIHMYCKLKFPNSNIVLFNSKLKTPSNMTYKQRKQYTIKQAELKNFPFPENLVKKDDLADAYWQAMVYTNNN